MDKAPESHEVYLHGFASLRTANVQAPTVDTEYQFGRPQMGLTIRQQARALVVRSRFESTRELANRCANCADTLVGCAGHLS